MIVTIPIKPADSLPANVSTARRQEEQPCRTATALRPCPSAPSKH